MKTNKSFTKRIAITKTGKLKIRRGGKNHFNAKESRSAQLNGKVERTLVLKNKAMGRFLPGLVK